MVRLWLGAVLASSVVLTRPLEAHQQPTTLALVDVGPDRVVITLQIPLTELQLATGYDVTSDTPSVVSRRGPELRQYLMAHVRPTTPAGEPWRVQVEMLKVEPAEQAASGPYQEITARLDLTPPPGSGTRAFVLRYDVVMHQVVTHKAIVSIRHDWEAGHVSNPPLALGVIGVDTGTSTIAPFVVKLSTGGWWAGFTAMVHLGMRHIAEGTDHLLFLLVLLLPATVRRNGPRWGGFAGTGPALRRLIGMVSAFTIGHSLTLLLAASHWVQVPQRPVEVLIAVSILVSALHAIRPLFPGREVYVAGTFGLVHGMAFASALADLHLSAGPLVVSIFGFNLGIECMQLGILAVTTPSLLLLSTTPVYAACRTAGAAGAAVAATAWVAERVLNRANVVTTSVQAVTGQPFAGLLLLSIVTVFAVAAHVVTRRRAVRHGSDGPSVTALVPHAD